jgi:DnaJ-class molecular chaperone
MNHRGRTIPIDERCTRCHGAGRQIASPTSVECMDCSGTGRRSLLQDVGCETGSLNGSTVAVPGPPEPGRKLEGPGADAALRRVPDPPIHPYRYGSGVW